MAPIQKIIAVSLLSIVAFALVALAGTLIKNMGDKGSAPESPKTSSAGENSTPEKETATDDRNSQGSVSEDDSGQAAIKDESSGQSSDEEQKTGQTTPWQTYSNDFYTLEYPADYKVSEKNKATGNIDFQVSGFSGEAVSFISSGKKALAFQGTWAVIAAEEARDQKLLATETVDMNGIRYEKNYWAIRQVDDGNWLAAIVYYGCDQDQRCFSMLRGVTAKGIPAWEEKTGSQLTDKIKIKTLVNVIKTSKETDTINFNNMFLTFRFNGKVTLSAAPAAGVAASAASKATKWKDCIFSPIVTASADSTDRKLVCVGDDGAQKIITESVKTTMGWGGLAEFYPNKVLFTPYSKEIYLTKYLSDSGSSSGVYALDITTLQSRRLANVGKIYEDYYNYISIISPDKKLIASLGSSELYILDFAADKATVVATGNEGEVLNPAGPGPEYKWLDNNTVQYPVYKNQEFTKPVEVRKAAITK